MAKHCNEILEKWVPATPNYLTPIAELQYDIEIETSAGGTTTPATKWLNFIPGLDNQYTNISSSRTFRANVTARCTTDENITMFITVNNGIVALYTGSSFLHIRETITIPPGAAVELWVQAAGDYTVDINVVGSIVSP